MSGIRQEVKKVAIAGVRELLAHQAVGDCIRKLMATGSVGSHILAALSASKRYELTVLVRHGSPSSVAHVETVTKVDYESDESLCNALRGQDVLISALGKGALILQPRLIDAAVTAGVQRIIPSEYGANLQNPKTRQFPSYRPKVLVEEQLERHQTQSGTSYTLLYTNCLLDWGLSNLGKLLLDPTDRTMRLFDGGDVKFSTTTMVTVGKAVVAILDHYDETANRSIYIHDVVTTQNELLRMARKATAGDGEKEWVTSYVDTATLEAETCALLEKSGMSLEVFYRFAVRGAFGKGYGGHFVENDNKLLGIKEMTRKEMEALVHRSVTQTGDVGAL